jgi:hypothetical protein
MSERGEKTDRLWEPERYRQDAHSPAAKLPEGDLVFFLLDAVSQLELRRNRITRDWHSPCRGEAFARMLPDLCVRSWQMLRPLRYAVSTVPMFRGPI